MLQRKRRSRRRWRKQRKERRQYEQVLVDRAELVMGTLPIVQEVSSAFSAGLKNLVGLTVSLAVTIEVVEELVKDPIVRRVLEQRGVV